MRNPKLLVLDETEDLSAQVRRAVASLRPRPEVSWCASYEAVDEVVRDSGPFNVLIARPRAASLTDFEHLRQLRTASPEMLLILAFDHWRSTSLRETVRTGALDVLRLPVGDADLRDAVAQAIEIDVAQVLSQASERADAREGPRTGTVIAVVSPTGGCGKTFLATNLAYYLQSQLHRETCLIDLDLQFGELSAALRLRPRRTIYDLISQEGDGETEGDLASRLEAHVERHDSGIRVLPAPVEPAQADAIEAADVVRVIEAARSKFDYVIVDTPAALSEAVLVAVEHADQILALATLDLPSVRNLGVMLTTLKQLKVPTDRIKLLLNKVEPDVGIDVARVEQYFPQGFSMVIPYGREVNRSLNMGQPVLAYAPRGEVSKILATGLAGDLIDGIEGRDEPVRPKRRRLLSRASKRSA